MEFIETFKSFIMKIDEGLIKTYDIYKTTDDITRLLSNYNIKSYITIENNNAFNLFIDEIGKIKELELTINYILDTIFNLYGWFPSKLGVTNFFGATNKFNFSKDYILNPSNNLINITITFESKFDKKTTIPEKLYHLSIQHYQSNIIKYGILPKSKSKISSHDYDGRIYLCRRIEDCKNLIYPMTIFYKMEKNSIIYSGTNKKKKYNKNTKWVIFEIDTAIANIDKLYQDPNYINGYYYLNNIIPESIKVIESEI